MLTDKMSTDIMSTDKMSTDKMSTEKMHVIPFMQNTVETITKYTVDGGLKSTNQKSILKKSIFFQYLNKQKISNFFFQKCSYLHERRGMC